MFNFAKLKERLSAGVAAVSTTDYSGNTDFLEAVCAVAARVAYADGSCSPQERQKTIDLVTGHQKLGGAFTRPQIEQTLDRMMRLAGDASGRQQLAREMDDVHGKPNGATMAEDAYLIGVDVAAADGNTSPEETEVLEKIAKRLGVDLTKFDV